MQLFRFICLDYILKELNFLFFLQKWSISDFPAKEKLCPSFPAEFFVCLKMGDFKQCIFMHIIQVCKTIFSAGFHGAKAPSSIRLKYRLYTNTQKVYESIPFISLNFSSPHPWPAPLHPTPWGFPAFPVFKDIQGIYIISHAFLCQQLFIFLLAVSRFSVINYSNSAIFCQEYF